MGRELDLLILHARQLLTLRGPSRPRSGKEMSELGIVPDGGVAIDDGKILEVGPSEALEAKYRAKNVLDTEGRLVSPGLVDPHTHAVFAGTRETEFEQRVSGISYQKIAANGGGIAATVRSVRDTPARQLFELARARLRRMLASGTTTVEIKSGYGLRLQDELKMLEVIRDLGVEGVIGVIGTFLGAHAIPEEFGRRTEEYVSLVTEEMLPEVAHRKLARFCDVFCEPGFFDLEQSRRVLSEAKRLGLGAKIHAEEFSPLGGAELAADLGAISADHLVAVPERAIARLREARVVAVLLPGTSFFLGQGRYAPARAMIDAGVAVALGTDCNPGTSTAESLPIIMTVACTQMKMTPAEAWVAATWNAACAVGEQAETSCLAPGKWADLVLWDADDYRQIPYRFGAAQVLKVLRHGRVVMETE